MYDILIGNKQNNVITKLQKSLTARILLMGCIWYMYNLFGRNNGLHIEMIFLIFIMGILLLNLIYIPFRLLGDKRIGHRTKFLFVVVADIAALNLFNATEQFSIASLWKNMISIVVISLCMTAIVSTLYKCLAVHSQRKLFVQRNFADMDGWEFEEWSATWLRQHGFDNVEVTRGSGDYGIDVIACKNNIKYGIQCKKYEGNVGWHAVEEAKAGSEYWGCQKAVVMTNSHFTKQAIHGAGCIGVELWDCEVIAG